MSFQGDLSLGEEANEMMMQFGSLDFTSFTKKLQATTLSCLCKNPSDKTTSLSLMEEMLLYEVISDKHNCILDNITRCFNKVSKETCIEDPYRLAFTDLFYRLRHELLFKCLMLSINMPTDKSDVPFSHFGIDSKRTPDLIVKHDRTLIIIEVAASSNFESAARMKGLEDLGFESKYQRELDILIGLSVSHVYVPVIFDMSDRSNKHYLEQIEKLAQYFNLNKQYKLLLDIMANSLCDLTNSIKEFIIPPSAFLFTSFIPIKKDHDSLNFLYDFGENGGKRNRVTYKEYYVSNPTYRKIYSNWHRIPVFLDRLEKNSTNNSKRYILILDVKTSRLSFEEDTKRGETIRELSIFHQLNDKPSLFKHTFLLAGDRLLPSINSETGVLFQEKVTTSENQRNSIVDYADMSLSTNHEAADYSDIYTGMGKYNDIMAKHYSTNYVSKDFDPDYETHFLDLIKENDIKCLPNLSNDVYESQTNSLLADMVSSEINIDEEMEKILSIHSKENTGEEEIPLKKYQNKSPFIMPLADFCSTDYESLDYKNITMIDCIINEISKTNPFTSILLEKVKEADYVLHEKPKQKSEHLQKLMDDKANKSRTLSKMFRDFLRSKGRTERKALSFKSKDMDKELSSMSGGMYDVIKKDISRLDKEIESRKKSEGFKRNIGLIRLPSKNKKTEMGQRFEKEMSHFKDKNLQSEYKGVGIIKNFNRDHEDNHSVFRNLTDILPDFRGLNPDALIDMNTYDDSRLLKDLKEKSLSDYKSLVDSVKNSMLGHASAFISRLGHSLLFYSQMAFNSDYIRVDNLGYNNCLLIVRGGKKIFKSKSSKLFRLFYPITECLVEWVLGCSSRLSSNSLVKISGRNFVLTPWIMWNESILTDSLSFYTRVTSFAILNLNPQINFREQFIKIVINVLLAFHNRRQTEVLLANMRYILLSTLGDFTGVIGVLPEFSGFNYDRFQSFIRSSIFLNYPKYFKTLVSLNSQKKQLNHGTLKGSNLLNIFTGEKIVDPDNLTLMIYSTFLMTKAPYQKSVERANNIKGILKIHEQYDNSVGLGVTHEEQYNRLNVCAYEHNSFSSYTNSLFKNDFSFDAKYCANLGIFADSYLRSRNLKDKLHSEWLRIMNKPWDTLATSTGLRGDNEKPNDFWGQKGYFVVYKNLSNRSGYIDSVKETLCSEGLSDDERRRSLRSLNKLYLEEINNTELKEDRSGLVFHVVDKVQWRGSREIYVMDLHTKTQQQPIEQFMGEICKCFDNELISIPSDKRAQVIHHSIFEKDLPLKDLSTWYLTLDCTKWAPKSIFVKFAIMILNMEVIPPSFKTHFLNYLEKLYKKKVYFNSAEVDVLRNNPVYKGKIEKYLIKDEIVGGYYMHMPYSWVMGIFNYTSSFMHAVNQLYSSYIISKSALENLGEDVSLTMFAHSDDSGGRLSCSNLAIARRCLMLYEVNLKCSNHLISRKKSVISKIYFEILSIIYLFKRLMALLPKFLGGIRFLPTDKGPSQDLLQSYSKCNEVMVAGANFSVAYIVMKMISMLIWRFYFNRDPCSSDYDRPVQYLGMPDSHPLMVLLSGSDSDIIRLITAGKGSYLEAQMNICNKITESIDEPGPIRPFKFNINVKNIGKSFERELLTFKEVIKEWSIKNVNFRSTPFNMLNFLSKLSDPGFVGSMTNESTTRRLSRCYYMRNNDSLLTRFGLTSCDSMVSALEKVSKLRHNYDPEKSMYENKDSFKIEELILGAHYENKEEFWTDFLKGVESSKMQMKVLNNVLSGPLKICRYLDKMSLKDREIRKVERSIKPTHIQLYKTGKCFSVNFDPAQLVSYLTKDKFLWALPGVKRMETASIELKSLCQGLGLDIDKIDENTLLKLCRNYSTKNVKDIYIYSQIPSDIRSIKTYSSFLSFIATNSFHGLEIGGLTLNLGNRLNEPGYINTQIDDQIYTHNTLLSLILTMAQEDLDFVKGMSLNPNEEMEWAGGKLVDYIKRTRDLKYKTPDYTLLKMQLEYLDSLINCKPMVCPDLLEGSSFFFFSKEQKSKSGWRGAGEIIIFVDKNYFQLSLNNDRVIKAYTNQIGKVDKVMFSFVLDVLSQNNIRFDPNSLQNPNSCNTEVVFGYDHSGDVSISKKREMISGVDCVIQNIKNRVIRDLPYSSIRHISKDLFIVSTEIDNSKRSTKIRSLRPKNSEFTLIASQMFVKEDFEERLQSSGLGRLEDFIYSELLIKMGAEAQVKFDDFYDNFNSSKIYKIVRHVSENDSEFIPSKVETSQIPASKGGMLRLFVEYERMTGEQIIKTPSNITPEILAIRNEYPEKFSLILREKMSESYENLFTKSERNEFYNSYMDVMMTEDENLLRSKIINLMCYWGYDSLVNSLNLFTFYKSEENYKAFRIGGSNSKEVTLFSNIFTEVMGKTIDCIDKYRHLYPSLEYPVSTLTISSDSNEITRYPMSLAYSTYRLDVVNMNLCCGHMFFTNLLLALMKDDEFCIDLSKSYAEVPAFSTLPIGYEYRRDLLATINTLKYSWLVVNSLKNGSKFTINPSLKLERLPEDVPQPIKIANKIYGGLKVTENVYHHGFLNDTFYNEICKNIEFRIEETRYRVMQRISKLSERSISISRVYKIPGQLEENVFEEDDWEDFDCELSTYDNEEEDILGFLEDTGLELKIKPSETVIHRHKGAFKTIDTIINWVINPGGEGVKDEMKRLNQTGENVIMISDCYYKQVQNLRNGFIRLVDLSPYCNKRVPRLFAHVIHNGKLKNEFWDYIIPGVEFEPTLKTLKVLELSNIRDQDGVIKSTWDIGSKNVLEQLSGAEKCSEDDVNENNGKDEVGEDSEQEGYSKALEYIEKFRDSGDISEALANELRLKYKKLNDDFKLIQNKNKKLDMLSLLRDIKIDNLLKLVNNEILFNLSKDQINKVMKSPEHFGVAHGISDTGSKHIKDKYVRAELNSVEKEIMEAIASGNLSMSKGMKNYCKSTFRLWNQSLKQTDYKVEQKSFMMTLFLLLVSDSYLSTSKSDDEKWQRIVNKIQVKIAEEEESEDSDDDEHVYRPNLSSSSRLFYRAVDS